MANTVSDIYQALFDRFGPQHWWPGETPFEVMVGAVLTQNTNWTNVSRAIATLKQEGLLSLEILHAMPAVTLADKIRPAGYYNLKAARLKNLLDFIVSQYPDGLDGFFALETNVLRGQLLKVKGIGPETADSIILYAAGKPVFVVDAYTHRILSRHALIGEEEGYDAIQEFFMDSLPKDVRLFNEYHALLVRLGKECCKKNRPLCKGCPLEGF
ncbi:MAG: endonuclease III domain-containing protein [Desulfobacterales bacterium]|nr:endonuclease III domain-containing protein [Desulfobacterales bacterium]